MARGLALWVIASLALSGVSWTQDTEGTIPTFGTTVVIPNGLAGRVYALPEGTSRLPDFTRLKPIGTIYTNSLQVQPRVFSQGFPGVTSRFEWFAIDYTARFWVEEPGNYSFALTSDDGSRLYIDDRLLIDNDQVHAAAVGTAKVNLSCGIHSIRVSYFQGPRYEVALMLQVSGGGKGWRYFDTDEFKPPPNPGDWNCDATQLLRARERDEPGAQHSNATFFRSAAYYFRDGANPLTLLAFQVPGPSLSSKLSQDGKTRRIEVAVAAFIKDADGRVEDKFSSTTPYEIAADSSAVPRAPLLTYTHTARLRPGRHDVEIAMVDRQGTLAGTQFFDIAVPEPHRGIALSSIALVDRLEPGFAQPDVADPLVFGENRAVPLLADTFSSGDKPYVYFVIYPDKTDPAPPIMQVEFLLNGKSVANQVAAVPPPGATGSVPMLIAAAATPGNCELKITVIQGEHSATESISYTVK